MTVPVTIPKELLDEVAKTNPFPWTQIVHPNGLVQVGDKNNNEVSIFLIIKVAIATGVGALAV